MKSKRNRYIIITLLMSCTTSVFTQTRIVDTKHNLSVSGTGTIKALTERQICVFCHTPHSPRPNSQLWNRQDPVGDYVLYSSDYLTSKNYPSPSQPKAVSKRCLSCHDGTIALGAVYNVSPGSIAMGGGIITMPEGAPGYIGTSLADDHPVGYVYDPIADPELVARSFPWNTRVKLDPDAANGTVECHTCHDSHNNEHGKFLRMSYNNADLCNFCHNKTNWQSSAHRTSNQTYTTPGSSITTVGEWSCRSCHKSHSGAGKPYLRPMVEENNCFQSGCHGNTSKGVSTKDVQTTFQKTFTHPTITVSGKHLNPDNSTSLNIPNRHAECEDCHNSHQLQKGLNSTKSNQVSNVLKGVRGVTPPNADNWTQPNPTNYTIEYPAVQENQICFKCHSSYAFGLVTNGVTSIVGPSGVNITDQAMEFNPANKSAHPVRVSTNNLFGSQFPRELTTYQMKDEWNQVGNQTMYCSDCHGNDQATSNLIPQGPHGSNRKFMLTGSAGYWPSNAFGNLWSLNDVKNNMNNWQNDLFCSNCHPVYSEGNFKNNVHNKSEHQISDVKCITCHVAVPHGAKRSRLVGYASDVAPYNYSGMGNYDKLVIVGFQKASSPNNYEKNNCSMNGVCHGAQSGVYEP
ncbi:MAG: hypothetical protein QME52_11615 [Bacteroidota bacterium]|nr:hypothetical protein [Bacteroidota bacterium]